MKTIIVVKLPNTDVAQMESQRKAATMIIVDMTNVLSIHTDVVMTTKPRKELNKMNVVYFLHMVVVKIHTP